MFRLIILCGLLVTLCIHCPAVSAADADVDAFAMMTGNIPAQADPTMRSFLQNIAIRLKKDWHMQPVTNPPQVLATFAIDSDRPWHIQPSKRTDEAQDIAAELVEKTLSGIIPPNTQPFSVLFVFDTYSANVSTIAKEELSIPGHENDVDFGLYMSLIQRRVKSNWILSKEHYKALLQEKVQSSWNLSREPQRNTKTVVGFTIKKDGSIEDVRLIASSNFSEYNKATLNAINNSAPFLPLPYGSPNVIGIQYTFEYGLQPKLNKNSDKHFTIHLAQPDVVTTDSVVYENSGHFKTF